MTFRNPILGGTTLLRAAIQSPNYLAGSRGWAVFQNGAAEFNNATIRNGEIVSGTSLYYRGTPGPGTLAFSISDTSGTDQYGNYYTRGQIAYSSGTTQDVGMVDGQLLIGAASLDFAGAASLSTGITGAGPLTIASGTSGNDAAQLTVIPGTTGSTTGGANVPAIRVRAADSSSDVDFLVPGSVVKTNQAGARETWQPPSYGTGWAAGPTSGSVQPWQFRKGIADEVLIEGVFHSTSTTPAATVCTLPAAYWPKKTKRVPVALNSSNTITAALMQITTAGVVSLVPAVAATSVDVQVATYYSLGNVT